MPRHVDDFAHDLTGRRAWLATLPEGAKPVLALPTAERLSRLDNPEAARALYRYAELMAPSHMVAANDNDPDVAAPEGDPDMRHEMRPGIDEMLDAASPGGPRTAPQLTLVNVVDLVVAYAADAPLHLAARSVET